MKRIEAIIRKTKFEDVKEALLSSDIDWFEYHNVHGIGQSRQERIYRGVQYSTDVIERVALTIVCRDQFVEPTVKVILEVAHTGESGIYDELLQTLPIVPAIIPHEGIVPLSFLILHFSFKNSNYSPVSSMILAILIIRCFRKRI